MYTSGLNPKINELYPTIQYPVSRGTPSIFGLPFWDHTEKWSDEFYEFVSTYFGFLTSLLITLSLYLNLAYSQFFNFFVLFLEIN